MSCVRPGVLLVRASFLLLVMQLIADDLPAFERPANAISMPSSGGQLLSFEPLCRKRALLYESVTCGWVGSSGFVIMSLLCNQAEQRLLSGRP